jgi:hypothetical protein
LRGEGQFSQPVNKRKRIPNRLAAAKAVMTYVMTETPLPRLLLPSVWQPLNAIGTTPFHISGSPREWLAITEQTNARGKRRERERQSGRVKRRGGGERGNTQPRLLAFGRVEVMMGRDVTREPVAMEIPAEEGPMASAARAPPRRIRMRLMEGARGGGAPASVEEIEARLREAELRRRVGVPVGFLFPRIFFTFQEFCLRCFSSLAWWVARLWRQLNASRAGEPSARPSTCAPGSYVGSLQNGRGSAPVFRSLLALTLIASAG